jgi:glycerol-3-phosphate acyltransferase PlsY
MVWLRAIGALLLAYLLGAIPMGYVAAKLIRNVDVRKVGSGHTGGTNVLRSAGLVPAALTVVGDFLKSYAAVALAKALVPGVPLVAALAGLAAVAGHNWPVFLGFHGGVGTMATVGAALMLMPIPTAIAAAAGILVIVAWRYASAGSLTLAVLLTIGCLVGAIQGDLPAMHLVFALGTSAMSIWALRSNIQRLRQGTERKIGQQVPPGATDVRKPQ